MTSPVILDVSGNGYSLTSRENGVHFDLDMDGKPELIPWTSRMSDDAWLVLDRNGNGRVDDGRELFGNATPQPLSHNPNGFAALGVFDLNHDGWIDVADPVYRELRLWHDAERNGRSELSELTTLRSSNVARISVIPEESRRRDRWGNLFRYRARVVGVHSRDLAKYAFDVFFTVEMPGSVQSTLPPTRPDRAALKRYKPGDRFPELPGVQLGSEGTLVMAISEYCRYCRSSVDFYKQLTQTVEATAGRINVVGLCASGEACGEFLRDAGINLAGVVTAELDRYNISATPTLLLLDAEGKVRSRWIGRLQLKAEREVIATVGSFIPGRRTP